MVDILFMLVYFNVELDVLEIVLLVDDYECVGDCLDRLYFNQVWFLVMFGVLDDVVGFSVLEGC